MSLGPDPGRGIVLSENESQECTIEKHRELLKNDKQFNRETRKTPLSVSAFSEMYIKQASRNGEYLSEKQANNMAKDFIHSQVQATNKSAFKANSTSFVVPSLPWKKRRNEEIY